MPRVLLVLAFVASPALAQPKVVVEAKEEQTVTATAKYTYNHPRFRADEWVLFAAVAPETNGQKKVKTTLTPTGTTLKEAGEFGRQLLRAKVPVKGLENRDSLTASLTIDATLYRRRLRELAPDEAPPKVAPLTAAEKKQFLATSKQIDHQDAAFLQWVAKLPEKKDTVDFAREVFEQIRTSAEYEYTATTVRSAAAVCKKRKTDCGGLAAWYVGALRAKGIPARMLVGRWAISSDGKEKLGDAPYHQWHVTTEFFADGVGWVPVDVSQAVTTKNVDTAKMHFGNDNGNFITFHFDPLVRVEPGFYPAKVVDDLQNIRYYARGSGVFDDVDQQQTWVVTKKAK